MTDQTSLFVDPATEASAVEPLRDHGGKRPRHYAAEILALPEEEREAAIARTPWPGLVGDHVASALFLGGSLDRLIEGWACAIAALPTTLQQVTEFKRLPTRHQASVAVRVEQLSGIRLLPGGEA